MEPVARTPGLGECIPNFVHRLGDELEGRAILLISGVRADLGVFSMCSRISRRTDSQWRERLAVPTGSVADFTGPNSVLLAVGSVSCAGVGNRVTPGFHIYGIRYITHVALYQPHFNHPHSLQ